MPWPWSRKVSPTAVVPNEPEGEPSPPADLPPTKHPEKDRPLAASSQFRIDSVIEIIGTGIVIIGELENGVIRPPLTFRLLDPTNPSEGGIKVEIIRAFVGRKDLAEVRPRVKVALVTRGLRSKSKYNPENIVAPSGRFPVKRGDRLTFP
jgi:hypothetical protein